MGSLNFGGSSFVQVADDPAFHLSDLTLEAWAQFQATDVSNGNTVIGKDLSPAGGGNDVSDSWIIWLEFGQLNGGYMAFSGSDAINTTWAPLPTDWHHVAYSRASSNGIEALYIDGTLVATEVHPIAALYDNSPVLIGADIDNATFSGFFTGSIAEVRVWSVARSTAEIGSDMTSCVSGNEANLVAAWNLDEGSGQVAHDLGPGHHDGQLGPSFSEPTWSANAPPQ